ncbi:MAG: MBL fold metallo-hydrolase [Methanotrichaceae archaeon]|nr:MBL fold metallo-hydrolase [Methanotrichaceae archaeon]
MDIIFLGTNGWYDTDTGNTICTLVNAENFHIILDAGNGIYKADRFIRDDKPVILLLSHFHLDHIVGLHILNKFNFPQGLHIVGQEGAKDVLELIINKPFTVPLADLPYPVQVQELTEGVFRIPFHLECRYLEHTTPCLGFRFELDGKKVAYVPDTGMCENAILLAEEADLLIAECSLRSGEQSPRWPHLNPQDAMQIARKANVKCLALVHFDAARYKTIQDRVEAGMSISDFKDVVVAFDDLVIEI